MRWIIAAIVALTLALGALAAALFTSGDTRARLLLIAALAGWAAGACAWSHRKRILRRRAIHAAIERELRSIDLF